MSGDCGGTAKRGVRKGRVRASTQGVVRGRGDESELPEGGLRVRWNGANVVLGGWERPRERYAHTGGWFSTAEI